MALLIVAALLAVTGCGGTAQVPAPSDDTISVAQAATPMVAGFYAEDLPTEPGSKFVYMANTPGTSADVSFDLDGPWNFTTGPTDAELTIAIENTEDAPKTEDFPDASLVAVSNWKANAVDTSSSSTTNATVASYTPPAHDDEGAPGGGLNIYDSHGRIVGQIPDNSGASNSSSSSSGAFNGMGSSAAVGNPGNAGASGAVTAQYGGATASQYGNTTTSSQSGSATTRNLPAGPEYNFQDKGDASWRSFGRLGPEERLRTYSGGVSVLKFPMAVGSTWTEQYTETEDGRSLDITAQNTVLAEGRVRVPAGAFNNGYLLQNKVTVTSGRGSTVTWDYIWFVPGVGRVAEIISQPGEKKDVFHSARSFFRLQEYHLP